MDEFDRLLEASDAGAGRRQLEAVCRVLVFLPARPEPQHGAAAGDVINRGGPFGEQNRVMDGDGGDHRH